MRPEITLPDQINCPGTGNLQVAGEAPLYFQEILIHAVFRKLKLIRLEPVEEPTRFDSFKSNSNQSPDADSKSFAKIMEAKEIQKPFAARWMRRHFYSQSVNNKNWLWVPIVKTCLKLKLPQNLVKKILAPKLQKAETMSVDPQRFWKRNGTANNIMASNWNCNWSIC